MVLARCSSNAIANGQDRHAGIEPVHRLRNDAAGFASLEEGEIGDGCSSLQCSTSLVQRVPGQLGWLCKKRSKRSSNSSLVS